MKLSILKNITFLVVASLLLSCNSSNNSTKKNEVVESKENQNLVDITFNQFENSNMKLGVLSKQLFTEGVKTNGHIDVPPANRAQVNAIMGGYIKKSELLVGDQVKKGQLLLTIENPVFIEIQQEYLEISESLKFLKTDYERQKMLFDEQITSEKKYLKAESLYKINLAKLNGLSEKLRLLNIKPNNVLAGNLTSIISIYAPIKGSVTNIYTTIGKYMSESQVLLEIIDSSHKHLELVVFEKDVLSIKKEQPIKFQIPENSVKYYDAEVHLIGKSIDEETRTVKVHGHLENEEEPFLVGMFVEAEIITNSIEKMALPLEAVLEEDNRNYILTLNKKNNDHYEFEKTPIEIGAKNENWIEILNPIEQLKEKQILIKGAFIPLEEGAGGHSH